MPRASDSTATAVNPGRRASSRTPWPRSLRNASIVSSSAGADGQEALDRRPAERLALLVLEVHEGLPPGLGADPRGPRLERRRAVVHPPQPQIAPVGGGDDRRAPGARLLGVGADERGVARAQRLVHLRVLPALVAELERRALPGRQQLQERLEARRVLF